MSLHRRKWSQKEKEEILLYADEHGVSKTSREYNVSTATIYNWKNKFTSTYNILVIKSFHNIIFYV